MGSAVQDLFSNSQTTRSPIFFFTFWAWSIVLVRMYEQINYWEKRLSCSCEIVRGKIKSPPSEWSRGACQSDALVIFSEQQVVSLVSTQHTVIAHLDLSYIRLSSLYLAREGSHLRCSINDAGLWMTHEDTKAMERFPTADATLDINSRHHAGNTAESHTGQHVWRLHLYLKSVARVSSQAWSKLSF